MAESGGWLQPSVRLVYNREKQQAETIRGKGKGQMVLEVINGINEPPLTEEEAHALAVEEAHTLFGEEGVVRMTDRGTRLVFTLCRDRHFDESVADQMAAAACQTPSSGGVTGLSL